MYVALATNIRDAVLKEWVVATDIHKVSLLYIHVGGTQAELVALLDKYDPPMNRLCQCPRSALSSTRGCPVTAAPTRSASLAFDRGISTGTMFPPAACGQNR